MKVAIDQSYLKQLVEHVNATHFQQHKPITMNQNASVSEISFDNPVDVVEMMPYTEFYSNNAYYYLNFNSFVFNLLSSFVIVLLIKSCW